MNLNPLGTKPGEFNFPSAIPTQAHAHYLLTLWLWTCLTPGFLSACRTAPRLASVNIAEPGWTLRNGQCVWRQQRDGPEVAGEIIIASHSDGRSLAQLTKTPLPLLTAQTAPHAWQIEFIPEKRPISGMGAPPTKLIWLHLARALSGAPPPAPLIFQKLEAGGCQLENSASGEMLVIYLNE